MDDVAKQKKNERLAKQLRDNLKRRKAQARQREAGLNTHDAGQDEIKKAPLRSS